AATWRSVVLPAPFGPSRIQRSDSETDQLTASSSFAPARTTVTSAISSTAVICGHAPGLARGWACPTQGPAPGPRHPPPGTDTPDEPGSTRCFHLDSSFGHKDLYDFGVDAW